MDGFWGGIRRLDKWGISETNIMPNVMIFSKENMNMMSKTAQLLSFLSFFPDDCFWKYAYENLYYKKCKW